MADPSADRPLLLPEKIFSEEDVEAAVQRLIEGAWEGDGGAGTRDDLAEIARVVLASAAARGRLLPSSAEHREEWGVRWHGADVVGYSNRDIVTTIARRNPHAEAVRRTPAGPWVEVDADEH